MTQNFRDGSLPLTLQDFERRLNDLSLRLLRSAHIIGLDTATFGGVDDKATRTVTHNLGQIPVFASASNRNTNSLFYNVEFRGTGTLTATTAEFRFQNSLGAVTTGGLDFQWIVFGV